MDADANLKDMNVNDVRATLMAHLQGVIDAADELRRRGVMATAVHTTVVKRVYGIDNYVWRNKYKRDEE